MSSLASRGRSAHEPLTLGRYELIAEIGNGGMGSVHLARASGPGGFHKWVAIKRVHPHLAKERAFIEMFLDEARIAAAVQHPNVGQVFDLGEAEGEYFLAMEYLHGEHLGSVVAQAKRALPYQIAAKIVALAAEGLHHAHEAHNTLGKPLGLIHRDVSPQNIFLTYDGSVKVTDFGIARAEGRLTETHSGRLKGKAAYMAPEQALGGKLDRRVDIFALGAVLWELTVGRRLFQSENDAETIIKIASQDVPRPSEETPDYPPELEKIVLRALAYEPSERYATARELATDLQRFAVANDGSPVGSADLAAFMEACCSEQRKKRELLLREASSTEIPLPVDVPTGEHSKTELTAHAKSLAATIPGAIQPASRPRWIRTWGVSAAWVAILGGGIAYLVLGQKSELATLRIETEPNGAVVIIDGEQRSGTTPLLVRDVAPGEHQIELGLPGREVLSRTVEVRGDADLHFSFPDVAVASPPPPTPVDTVQAPLEPEPPEVETAVSPPEPVAPPTEPEDLGTALLTLLSNPGGATVTVGGRTVGTTPLVAHPIPAGRRVVVRVQSPAGDTRSLSIRAGTGERVNRRVDFTVSEP